MEWLFEGSTTVYVCLAAAALTCVYLGWRARRADRSPTGRTGMAFFLAGLAVLLLVATYALLNRLVDTRREKIRRALDDMCVGVRNKDIPLIFKHFSEDFKFQTFDKTSFTEFVRRAAQNNAAEDLVVWDVTFIDRDTGKVVFRAKPKSQRFENVGFLVRGEFKREANGEWKLTGFELFPPAGDSQTPLFIPQMPW